MRKNFLIFLSTMFISILAITGCQKETKQLSATNEPSIAKPDDDGNGCRMTMWDVYDPISDTHSPDYFTYKNGKVDEWTTYYGAVIKMKYDVNGKMKSAEEYFGGTLSYTVKFVHQMNRVVKEIWYVGNTNTEDDEVTNTYNHRGEMIKNESMNYDYYTLYTYYPDGELKSWTFYVDGEPLQRLDYTSYDSHYKDPFLSAKGIEYTFAYGASGQYSYTTSIWPTGKKWTDYDENGNPTVYYDFNPKKTVWHLAQENYPQLVDYTDKLSGKHFLDIFDYENCSGEHDSKSAEPIQNKLNNRNSFSGGKSMRGISRAEIIEKVKALRQKK